MELIIDDVIHEEVLDEKALEELSDGKGEE